MRTKPGTCARKARYASEEDALAVAARAPFALRPYRCALCRSYHLTGRTKGMKLPAFEQERRLAVKRGAPLDSTPEYPARSSPSGNDQLKQGVRTIAHPPLIRMR